MKRQRQELKRRVLERLDLPAEAAGDLIKVTALGNGQITVENYEGISSFSDGCIVLRHSGGRLTIRGTGLHIVENRLSQLFLRGEINSFCYES